VNRFNIKRINVIGTSGSGKTTFSRQLAQKLGYPYIEMDALYWKANWQETEDEEFFAKIAAETNQKTWVLDGNYSRADSIKWKRADTIIWIDYSLSRTLYQSIKRTLIRCWTKQELWPNTGNKETFGKSFFSRDSVVRWMLVSYKQNQIRYAQLPLDANLAHINFVRLTSPNMAKVYLENLSH